MTAVAAAFLVLLIVSLAIWAARPPHALAAGDLRLHALATDVFLYRGYFSNSAVLVCDGGVVVVDTQVSPLAARRLRDAIEHVTTKPIRYVVNTHYHGDHTGGNAIFPEAEIVATEATARFVVERDSERREYAETFGLAFQEYHPTVPPTLTFRERLVLELGRDAVEVLELGRAETPDACVVYWPARRVVATGDGVSTIDYPYLGVPLLDEGLRDDGEWPRYLEAIRDLRPALLLPGHGPPLVGEPKVAARLELLVALMRDLIREVKRELEAGTRLDLLVERVHGRLAHYARRRDLNEHTVSQRFAIYRCVNNLQPERKGKGWWHDLRPSVVGRAAADQCERELAALPDGNAVCSRARTLGGARRYALAIPLLEAWVRRNPADAAAFGLLADLLFDAASGVRPTVDATEYIAASAKAGRTTLLLDPDEPLGLLAVGANEVFGAMVLAQPMANGIAKLERALASGMLTAAQRRKAHFFLGKAHQMELRDAESDRWYGRLLPRGLAFLYPLLRARLRAYP